MDKTVTRVSAIVVGLGCATAFALLIWARYVGLIATSDLVTGLSVVIGAILAVSLAAVQIRATQFENDRARTAEVRRSVEVDAFKSVTAAVVDLTKRLADIGATFAVAGVTLGGPVPPPEILCRDLSRNYMARWFELSHARNDFIFTIESHEIVLVPYHHFRLFIQFRIDDVGLAINRLAMAMVERPIDPTSSLEDRTQIAQRCTQIGDSIQVVLSYLLDYRIEVMNGLLGDLFARRVPKRQPLVAHLKTLGEVATPSAVMAEEQQRIMNAAVGARE